MDKIISAPKEGQEIVRDHRVKCSKGVVFCLELGNDASETIEQIENCHHCTDVGLSTCLVALTYGEEDNSPQLVKENQEIIDLS